jgi:glycine betaine/choline ABC-type transport system substrate-binding protein
MSAGTAAMSRRATGGADSQSAASRLVGRLGLRWRCAEFQPSSSSILLPLFTIFAILGYSACGRSNAIIVGSKNFTEQIVLGEIAAQQIGRKLHVPVERRLDLGGTMLAHLALKDGDIDLYPEYTGTALTTVLKQPLSSDEQEVFATVRSLYRERFRLQWLSPLGFNDSFAMAVRNEDAARLAHPTLSAAASRSWQLGVGYEFLTRPDGLTRLDAIYHLRWQSLPRTMDLGLLYRALNQGQIDMAAANTTDGLLTSGRYTVLEDDKHAFPPYQACFVVREDVVKRVPGLEAALAELSGRVSDSDMRALNKRVDLDHVSATRVAADFLAKLSRPKQ